jgi:hypothetical protein
MTPRKIAKKLTFYYDKSWLTWDPDVLAATLEQKFGDDFTEEKFETVEAMREVIRSDRFSHEPLVFENCVRAFNGAPLSFDVWQPVTEEQLGYGLHVMRELVGNGPIGEGMGEQVRAYVATILAQAPIAYAAPHFGFDPAAEPLRRLIKDLDLRDDVGNEWDGAMGSDPDTPRQLYRHIRGRFVPGEQAAEDLSPGQEARFRHVTRLATIWEYMFDRNAQPSSTFSATPPAQTE